MNRPVLDAVSPENDFDVTDPNQTIGTYSILFIFTTTKMVSFQFSIVDFFPFFESRRRRDVPGKIYN